MKYVVVEQTEIGFLARVSGERGALWFGNAEQAHAWLGQQSAVKVFGEPGVVGTYRLPSK